MCIRLSPPIKCLCFYYVNKLQLGSHMFFRNVLRKLCAQLRRSSLLIDVFPVSKLLSSVQRVGYSDVLALTGSDLGLLELSVTRMSSRSPEVTRGCWSCRLLSGSALMGSAGFVYWSARASPHRGGRTSVGTALQLAFAAGLALWGVVVIVDPVSKNPQKSTGG